MNVKIIERKGEELQETTHDNVFLIENDPSEENNIILEDEDGNILEELNEEDILYFSEIIIIKK